MTKERDGAWEQVGSKLRDALRDEYTLCGESCVYVDMVKLKDHSPTDWHDHSAVHAIFVLAYGGYDGQPAWPQPTADAPALREDIRSAFSAHADQWDRSFEDERDEWADRHAIVALQGINSFMTAQTQQ